VEELRRKGEERQVRFGLGSSAPAPRASDLSPSTWLPASVHRYTVDDGLQVSITIVYMRLTLTRVGSSTNARFIESLDPKYKTSIDRVQSSRRDDPDGEDEDALFAELEAELENADSAALRDKGLKDMRTQLRRFSYI
jgi:hypothetical protein